MVRALKHQSGARCFCTNFTTTGALPVTNSTKFVRALGHESGVRWKGSLLSLLVQSLLSLLALLVQKCSVYLRTLGHESGVRWKGTQFTRFTGTKVQNIDAHKLA